MADLPSSRLIVDGRRHAVNRSKGELTGAEQRFYASAPRFEDHVRRVCGRSVVLFRSDIAESLLRGLEDFERDYLGARGEASGLGRPVADLEARFGAAIVVVHLQIISKVDEIGDLAEAATPVSDVRRLSDNLASFTSRLAEIETRCSIATTGDLNEEERNKVRHYKSERFVHVAEAVQLRREAQAATRRFHDGENEHNHELQRRALGRIGEIRTHAERLRAHGDVGREVALDQILRQVFDLTEELTKLHPGPRPD